MRSLTTNLFKTAPTRAQQTPYMERIREEKKTPSAADLERMRLLDEETHRVLDLLSRAPSDSRLVDRLNQLDIAYVRLSGEKTIDY